MLTGWWGFCLDDTRRKRGLLTPEQPCPRARRDEKNYRSAPNGSAFRDCRAGSEVRYCKPTGRANAEPDDRLSEAIPEPRETDPGLPFVARSSQ